MYEFTKEETKTTNQYPDEPGGKEATNGNGGNLWDKSVSYAGDSYKENGEDRKVSKIFIRQTKSVGSYNGSLCDVDGCEREAKARKFCLMHYQRLRKHGDPGAALPREYRDATSEWE